MAVQIFHSVLLAHCALFTNLCLQCFSEKGKNPSKPFKFLTFWKRMYFENERTFSKGFQGKLCHHYSNCPQNLHNAMVLKNWQIFIPFIARPKEQFCCSCQIHIKFSSILFASNFGLIFLWNWLIHFWLNFVKLLQKQTVYFLSHAEYLNGNTKRKCCPQKSSPGLEGHFNFHVQEAEMLW